MKGTRKLTALLTALGMMFTLSACGGGSVQPSAGVPASESPAGEAPGSEAPASQTADGGIVVRVGAEPRSIDPTLAVGDGAVVVSHLFEGLMKWSDSGAAMDGRVDRAQLTCGQAEHYAVAENDDGTVTYTFYLRADARWSDGKPVTAHDFVYAWRRLADPATDADYGYLLDCVVNARDILRGEKEPSELAVQAVDDGVLQVTVRDAPYFLRLCAHPATFPVRQDAVDEAPDHWTHDPETCVSNGMYKLSAWDHYSQIVLVPNGEYYDPAVRKADTLTFQLLDEDSAQTAYDSGALDFALVPGGSEADDGGSLDYAGTYFLTFQTQAAPFDDPRVREAFTLAVDRSALVRAAQPGQTEAGGYVPAGISDVDGPTGRDFRAVGGDYVDPGADACEKNRQRARELLAQAGYPDGAGFPEVTYLYNTGEVHQAAAEALREMWQEVLGVTVTLEGKAWTEYLRARRAGDFAIARGSWTADYDDPLSFFELWRSVASGNAAHYENADYDALVDAAGTCADPGERMELLHRAEDLLVGQDYALCPLYFYTRTYRMDDDLEGVYYTPMGYFFFNAATRD